MDPSTVPTLYREAQDLLRTDAEGAVARLTAASESGDLGSKFQLAVLLLDRDFEKAARLLMELDAAEFDGAARLLGMSYWTMDVEVAKRWYRRALARGGLDADRAAREFGLQMVNENPTEAARLLEQALNAGLAVPPYWLAAALERTDPVRALGLYDIARAEAEEPEAHFRAGQLCRYMGDMEGARCRYERGASLHEPLAMLGLFTLNLRQFHLVAAVQWYRRFIRAGGIWAIGPPRGRPKRWPRQNRNAFGHVSKSPRRS